MGGKNGLKTGMKGPSSLLRGGIPIGSSANKKSSKLPGKPSSAGFDSQTRQAPMKKPQVEESKSNAAKDYGFYDMNDLAEILGIQTAEVPGSARASISSN